MASAVEVPIILRLEELDGRARIKSNEFEKNRKNNKACIEKSKQNFRDEHDLSDTQVLRENGDQSFEWKIKIVGIYEKTFFSTFVLNNGQKFNVALCLEFDKTVSGFYLSLCISQEEYDDRTVYEKLDVNSIGVKLVNSKDYQGSTVHSFNNFNGDDQEDCNDSHENFKERFYLLNDSNFNNYITNNGDMLVIIKIKY